MSVSFVELLYVLVYGFFYFSLLLFFGRITSHYEKLGYDWFTPESAFFLANIFRKSKSWEYENEFRIFLPEHNGLQKIVAFRGENNNQLLKLEKIIVGNRLARKHGVLSLIENTAKSSNIKVKELDIAGQGYDYQLIAPCYQ